MYRFIVKGCQMQGTLLCTKLSEFILCILCVKLHEPQEEHGSYLTSKQSINLDTLVCRCQSSRNCHKCFDYQSWLHLVTSRMKFPVSPAPWRHWAGFSFCAGPYPAILSQCATCIDAFEFEMISSRVCLRQREFTKTTYRLTHLLCWFWFVRIFLNIVRFYKRRFMVHAAFSRFHFLW